MTTLWWLVVLALTFAAGFLAGCLYVAEVRRYRRDVVELDFTRRKVGL